MSVEILTGAAGAGKTLRLLDRYRGTLERDRNEQRPGRTLWLAPTTRARRAVLSRLLNGAVPASFAPNVFTFDEFAERILQFSGTIRPISPVMKRMLVRRIVADLLQNERLRYFAGIAHTTGFLDLVTSFISELKRDEIWPEHFAEACGRGRRPTDKDRELALIYQEYQDRLVQLSLYDTEGRFWSAREALRQGSRAPFHELSLVVADGFTDFTVTQYEILQHLAEWAEQMVITLPLEEPLRRRDLFAKSAVALERLHKMRPHGIAVRVEHCPIYDGAPAEFQHIAEHLFANPRETPRLSAAPGIELLAATGQIGEIDAVAQRVKRLLLDGVPPEDILIGVRSLDETAEQVCERFTEAGIPVWCELSRPLAREPRLKALFALLQMEAEDWRFDRLMAVLDSSFVRPGWEEWQDGAAVRSIAAQLRGLKLNAQRTVMLRELQRRLRWHQEQPEEGRSSRMKTDALSASRALPLLERLSAATAPLRQTHPFGEWAGIVLSLAAELGIAPAPSKQKPAAQDADDSERRAWESFERVLRDAVRAEEQIVQSPRGLSLAEFITELRDLLASQRERARQREEGCVRVLEAAQLRSLDAPYLFLPGLTETSFPLGRGEDCLYGEAERRELNEHGLSLGHRASHNQAEMLLFYGVVTRARRRLVLSYPAVSVKGQPLFPSPYVTALTDLFEPGALEPTRVGRLDPVPEPAETLTTADLRLVAVEEARQRRPGLFRSLLDLPETASAARGILAAVTMNIARFRSRGLGAFEGVLTQPANVELVRARFGPDTEFSATQLEAYAHCPFRFFASHLLGVEALETPDAGTDHRARGTLVHAVLSALHQPVGGGGTGSLSGEQVSARFRELVEEQLGRGVGETELQQALKRVEMRLLCEWGDAYGTHWMDYLQEMSESWSTPPTPTRLEVAFGNAPAEEGAAAKGEYGCLVFENAGTQARVRGRIDRVDVGHDGEKPLFTVIDYKSGKPDRFSQADVRAGCSLQLALYTLAVRRLGIAGPEAAPFQMGYWSLKGTGFLPGLKSMKAGKPIEAAVLESLEETLEQIVPALAEGIRSGRFGVFSQDKDCTGRCEYRTVCRVNQVRPLEEALEKRLPIGGRNSAGAEEPASEECSD